MPGHLPDCPLRLLIVDDQPGQPAPADCVSTSQQNAPIERTANDARAPLDEFSDKETLVPERITRGMSNQGIAAATHLAEGTVSNYLNRIMSTLHARSRTELAISALGGVKP